MPKIENRPPAWMRCTDCGDFWCNVHRQHVADCACPPPEAWTQDPYSPDWFATPRPVTERRDA
jgi:hypothetical protein